MSIFFSNINNSNSLKDGNKKNRIISTIFAISIIILLLFGLFNYSVIQGLQEEISSLKNSNMNLNDELDILSNQKQSYDSLLFTSIDTSGVKNYNIQSDLGKIVLKTSSLQEAIMNVSHSGKIVKFKSGIYDLDKDVQINSKSNMIFDGQESTLNLNGHSISVTSDNHENNSYNQVRNFNFYNGTLKFENSYGATVEHCNFVNCISAFEISNTQTWSEFTRIVNVHWNNCRTCLTFKTPIGPATGSYENTILDSCTFNLLLNNSIGIFVEDGAHFANSQLTNSRIWIHANNNQSQTGLHVEGKMTNTILSGSVFESFEKDNESPGNGMVYGIFLGNYSTGFSDEGTNFLGNYTARISNLESKWIYGVSSSFRESFEDNRLTFGNKVTIQRDPYTIGTFNIGINISNLNIGEVVTVKLTLNFEDHATTWTEISFTENDTHWLREEHYYELYPSQNLIRNIEATLVSETNAIVRIGAYGTLR